MASNDVTEQTGPGEVLSSSPYFCVLPWIHLCGSVDGIWGRCCVDSSMYHDDQYATAEPDLRLPPDAIGCSKSSPFADTNQDHVLNIEDAFNSPAMRRTRLAMLSDQPVSACSYCYDRESGGGESYRQKMNATYADDIAPRTQLTQADGSLPLFPSYLDIRFGNTCNLACIMCGYPVSSRWGLEKHPNWAPAHIDPYRDDEGLWTILRAHATDLRKVYFAGGEPFLQQGHFRMLDLLIETGAASHIRAAYTSNLTVLPAGIFDKLAHFDSVGIGASCDGVGEVFERIRVGAKWSTFVTNLQEVKRHVPVWLAVTPQRDNVMNLGEIIDFGLAEGVPIDLTNLLQWPEQFSVQSMDGDEKAAAAQYLDVLRERCVSLGRDDIAAQVEVTLRFMQSPRPTPQ